MKLQLATTSAIAVTGALALGLGVVPLSDAAPLDRANSAQASALLTIGSTTVFSTLNPINSNGCNIEWCALIYEHLLKVGSTGKLEPNLARSFERRGAKTFVYRLRRGVRFWNGNEMTSADVVNSLNYQRYPGTQTQAFYTSVKNVYAIDRYTVVVTLKRRDEAWQYVPAFTGLIFEKKFFDEHKETFGRPGTGIMATGPWRVDSLDPTTGVELSAHRRYWGGSVPFQRISIKRVTTETNAALAMRAGDIDVFIPNDPATYASTSGARVTSVPANTIGLLGMNTQLAPWNDVHVRRAVAYAIDRRDIVRVFGGYARPIETVINPRTLAPLATQRKVTSALQSLPKYPFDLAKARAEMAQSAHPKGFSATSYATPSGAFVQINEVLAAQLAKIGINLKVTIIPNTEWVSKLLGPKTYEVMVAAPVSNNPDPSGHPTRVLGRKNIQAGINFANYAPNAVEDLLKAGLGTPNQAQRLEIYRRLLRRLAIDVPYVPLYLFTYNFASRNYAFPGMYQLAFRTPWALKLKPR